MNFLAKMAMPLVKKFIIKQIKDEQFQVKLVEKLEEKVTFPKVSKAQQKKFINEVYDSTQEILVEFVQNL